jgi:hypothetical protein
MEGRDSFSWIVAGFFVGVLVLWIATPFAVKYLYSEMPERGQFGDLFGTINALFSGLAFVGIIAAILLQRQELQLQREELTATRVELRRTAEAQEGLVKDTRILQRAYLSANPHGIGLTASGESLLGHVQIENVGHLPARNVSGFYSIDLSSNGAKKDFNFEQSAPSGRIVLPPGAKMILGTPGIELSNVLDLEQDGDCYLYVWGKVSYEDGFGRSRHTNFCHRYNYKSSVPPRYDVAAESARYHAFGNEAD